MLPIKVYYKNNLSLLLNLESKIWITFWIYLLGQKNNLIKFSSVNKTVIASDKTETINKRYHCVTEKTNMISVQGSIY